MQKKIITWLLIILVLVGGWWAYRQWTLLGFLLDEKGNSMHEGYYSYVRYFNEVEQLTAQLLLSNEPLEGFPTQNYFNYSLYEMRYRNIAGTFHRYGLVGEELRDYQVKNFVRLTDNYFNYLLGQGGQLTAEDRDFLTKIHLKTKELNDILGQYTPQLRALRGKEFFYSNIWVQAINEMNASFQDYPDNEFSYSYPWYSPRQERVLQPGELEAIYGKELTSSQVRDSIQNFLGAKDRVAEQFSGQGGTNIHGSMWESYGFETKGGYYVEAFTRGGRVIRLEQQDWRHRDHSASYRKPQVNTTTEEAITGLREFLAQRDMEDLEIQSIREIEGQFLRLELLPKRDGYLAQVSPVYADLDLTRGGEILSLDFFSYWLGQSYKDSGKEEGLAGYEKARQALQPGLEPKATQLIGTYGQDFEMDFYWRFTVELENEDYYILVNPQTGGIQSISSVDRGYW